MTTEDKTMSETPKNVGYWYSMPEAFTRIGYEWFIRDGVDVRPTKYGSPMPLHTPMVCCGNCEKQRHGPAAGVYDDGTSWGHCQGPQADDAPVRKMEGGAQYVRDTDRCAAFRLRLEVARRIAEATGTTVEVANVEFCARRGHTEACGTCNGHPEPKITPEQRAMMDEKRTLAVKDIRTEVETARLKELNNALDGVSVFTAFPQCFTPGDIADFERKMAEIEREV